MNSVALLYWTCVWVGCKATVKYGLGVQYYCMHGTKVSLRATKSWPVLILFYLSSNIIIHTFSYPIRRFCGDFGLFTHKFWFAFLYQNTYYSSGSASVLVASYEISHVCPAVTMCGDLTLFKT